MASVKRVTANTRAIAASAQFIAYAIVALVVLYSDLMFVSLMWAAFPGGFLTIAAVGGAFATGISIIALVIGKSHWFRPGGQLVWAWCFTAIEIAISILNVVVSVMHSLGQPLGYLATWMYCAPATPLVALVGWVLILYMDRARAQLHEQMEMEDDLADAEREHRRQVHEARMEVKRTALEQQKEYLKMYLADANVQAALAAGSYEITRSIVSEIVQKPIMPQIAPVHIVETTAQIAPSRAPATPARQAVPRSLPRAARKRTVPPARRFVPAQPARGPVDTEELRIPKAGAPAQQPPIKIKQGTGPYIVHRHQRARVFPTND